MSAYDFQTERQRTCPMVQKCKRRQLNESESAYYTKEARYNTKSEFFEQNHLEESWQTQFFHNLPLSPLKELKLHIVILKYGDICYYPGFQSAQPEPNTE